MRRLDSWDPIEIPESEGAINPFWSPDGQWLAFSINKEMWKVRQDGTQRIRVSHIDTPVSNNTGGAWLADDRIAFRGAVDMLVIPAAGGNIDTLYSATDDSVIVDFHQPRAVTGGRGLISVVHTRSGVNTIGFISTDGVLTNLLTIPDAALSHACYAPSGHILFQRDRDIWAVGFSLEKVEVTGEPIPVVRDAAVPSVSNQGTLTYVRNAGEILRQLVLVNRSGEIVERLGQPADVWAAYTLTPDGTRAIAAPSNSTTDLWVFDNRMASTRITFTDLEHDMPAFSWDGRTVYFATGIDIDYRIGSKSVDRNETEKVLVPAGNLGPHYYGACPSVNRDETLLFYTSIGANTKQDIAWLDLTDDKGPQAFLTGEAAEFAGRPSPADHRFIAYVSDESGTGQVYLTTWPEADRKLPVSIDGGFWPRWKGDGSELYFAIKNDIYAVDVKYDPLSLGRPVKLFSRPEYDDRQPHGWPATFDVTADGERFLVTELVTGEQFDPGIAIIQNWASSLEGD